MNCTKIFWSFTPGNVGCIQLGMIFALCQTGRYQSKLEPYTRDELIFPGVSIEKVEIDRLVTYFDEFYADLSQAVFYSEEELRNTDNEFFVRAKQYRLNHKPFNCKIHVKSDKDVKAVVKILIGPKQDEYERQSDTGNIR